MRGKRVTAVLLAAGEAKRMGTAKQLLPWGKGTILSSTIENVKRSQVDDLLLVTGHRADEVAMIAQQLDVPTVHNPEYAEGEMLSSLKTAVRHLNPTPDAILVMLADQPMVEAETINAILTSFFEGQADLIAPTHNGKRGNPVLMGQRYFDELLALSHGDAPRTLLKKHADKLMLLPVQSDVILRDVDTPEAYKRWRPR